MAPPASSLCFLDWIRLRGLALAVCIGASCMHAQALRWRKESIMLRLVLCDSVSFYRSQQGAEFEADGSAAALLAPSCA